MTNEEKARIIAEENKCCYPEDMAYEDFSDEECYTSALEMAEWKDQQFKEYLEKKKAEIDRIDDYGIYTTEISLTAQSNLLDEIINELFKEE